MVQVTHHKIVNELPAELEASSLYFVRRGAGFDLYVTNDAGVVVPYSLNSASVHQKVVTETEETYALELIRKMATLVADSTWRPAADALSVVPNLLLQTTADTASGDVVDPAHQVSLFHYILAKGGGSVATQYGQEFRVGQEAGTHLERFIATKHVIDPTTPESGTLGEYVTEQFDDMRAAVTHVERFLRYFLDPRMITVHAGGEIRLPKMLTANYTATDADSGKDFFVVSATPITVTVPATVTDGWKGRFFQMAAGAAQFNFSGMTVVEPDGLTATQGQGYSAVVSAAPSGPIAFLQLTKPPRSLYPGVTPGRTYGPFGRNTLLPVNAVALVANALYPVPVMVTRRLTLDTLGIRVTAALASRNLRLALFRDNGFGAPGVRVYQSANLSTASAGDKQVTGLGLVLEPGMYFIGVICSGAAQVNWSCNHSLEQVFGRGASVNAEIVPAYAATLTTIPANLSATPPSAYLDTSSYVPDVYWKTSA